MIFISYRTSESIDIVARLNQDLKLTFGEDQVFLDQSNLQGGEDYPEKLQHYAKTCEVMLVMIGPIWQTVAPDTGDWKGVPKLLDPEDWVRKEITFALEANRLVIPVSINPVYPAETHVPPEGWLRKCGLEGLSSKQGIKLRSREYESDFESLAKLLVRQCPGLRRISRPSEQHLVSKSSQDKATRLASIETSITSPDSTRTAESAGDSQTGTSPLLPRAETPQSLDVRPELEVLNKYRAVFPSISKSKAVGTDAMGGSAEFLICFLGARLEHRIPHEINYLPESNVEPDRFYNAVSAMLDQYWVRRLMVATKGIYIGPYRNDVPAGLENATINAIRLPKERCETRIVDCNHHHFFDTVGQVRAFLASLEGAKTSKEVWAKLIHAAPDSNSENPLFTYVSNGNRTLPLVPLRTIAEKRNRDILGLLIPVGETASTIASWSEKRQKQFNRETQSRLAPFMMDLVVTKTKYKLKTGLRRRSDIQRTCLEAALAATGADWGCIKTKCIGASDSDGNMAAECVFHCPRFYDEGVFPEADNVISKVVQEGQSKVVRLGENKKEGERAHPARGAFVQVVTPDSPIDFDDPASPRFHRSAMVLQHVDDTFLRANEDKYRVSVGDIGSMYTKAIKRLVHDEAHNAISLLRRDIKNNEPDSLKSLAREIASVACEVASPSDKERGRTHASGWALFSWDYGIDDKKELLAMEFSDADEREKPAITREEILRELLGIGFEERKFQRSLLYFSCNSRHPLVVKDISPTMGQFMAFRHSEHKLNFKAQFSTEEISTDTKDSTILLGKREVVTLLFRHQPFSVLTIPLVAADGLPVGSFVAAIQNATWSDEAIETMMNHHNTSRIGRVLFQLRHRLDVANKIAIGEGKPH